MVVLVIKADRWARIEDRNLVTLDKISFSWHAFHTSPVTYLPLFFQKEDMIRRILGVTATTRTSTIVPIPTSPSSSPIATNTVTTVTTLSFFSS